MKKYTIQELIDNKLIHVKCQNKDQWIKLGKHLPILNMWMGDNTSYCSDRTYMSKDRGIPGYDDGRTRWLIISFDQVDFEEFILPEKWCVNVEDREKEIIAANWLNSGNSQNGIYSYDELCKFLHYPECNDSHHFELIRWGYTEITFEQFEKYVLNKDKNMAKKITGYKLIKKYPGCKKELGYVEPYTTGEFSQYPEFWKPICEEQTKTLILGTGKIVIIISKNKITANSEEFSITDLKNCARLFTNYVTRSSKVSNPNLTTWEVKLTSATIKIGCSEFSLEEIKLICDTYDSLNK